MLPQFILGFPDCVFCNFGFIPDFNIGVRVGSDQGPIWVCCIYDSGNFGFLRSVSDERFRFKLSWFPV